jgi:uncharacterized membrane protein YgcG
MANPKIEVEIGAVIDGLRKGFGESVKIIETLEKQALDLDKALKAATDLPTIQGLNAQLAQTKAALSQLKTSGIDPLTKATSNYNSVGTDFARIIQDAPFGIIGVGNNIQQLAGSFQQLKNSTGSTGGAVKAALASILSPANALVLGISVLTTALTVLQMQGFFKTEEAAKSLNEELNEYREKLDNISAASIKGQANASKEIQNFKLLQIQAENTNIPLNKRIEAVEELQKSYPDYLGNLTQEQILNGNVGESYKLLSESIIAKAKAQAFSNAISENALKIATFENQIIEKQVELEKARAAALSASNNTSTGGGIGQPIFSEKAIAEAKVRDILKEQEGIRNEILKVQKQDEDLTKRIVDLSSQGASFTKTKTEETKKTVKENENLKRTFEDLSKIDPFITFANLERRGSFFEDVEKQLVSIESGVARTRGIYQQNISAITQSNQALVDSLSGSGISVEQFYAAIANGAAQGFSSLNTFITSLSETQAFINETFDILEKGAENTLGDVAFSIGDALASGGNVIKAAGGALLGGLAGILNQLGQLAIATGLAVEGIKTALKTLNPAVAIGAGVALIALAGFVSNKAKSLGGSRGGSGGGGGSSVGSSGVGGGTSFAGGGQGGLFQQNRDVSGEFVVKGADLVYVLGQANNRINKG